MALSSTGVGSGRDVCKIAADSTVALEPAVAGASPQRLTVMLYDGALAAMQAARAAIRHNDADTRGAALSRAIAIIDEGLRPAVDPQAGGKLAAELLALYAYIANRLLYANLKADGASIDEAAWLLRELRGAWETLERQALQAAGSLSGPQRVPQERFQQERTEPGRSLACNVALSYGRV